jgi:hypothetical protein
LNKEIKKNVLFVTSRPQHILLSIMLATKFKLDQNFNTKNYLIILDFFNEANIYEECLYFWNDNPFYKIIILPPKNNKYRVLRYIKERKTIKKIKSITKKINPNTICTFSDVSPFFQAPLQIQQKLNCGKTVYVEDGIAPYYKRSILNIQKIKRYLEHYIYGIDYLSSLGTHPQITEMYVNYPELIDKKRYSHLKINRINRNLYNIFEKSKFIEKLLSFSECDIYSKLDKIRYIIVLPQSDAFKKNNKLLILYKEIFKKLIKKKYNFAIKFHPTDYNKNYMQIENKLIFEIPSYLPIEIIYIMLRNINKEISIIGSSSTAILINPGILLPCAKVYSLIRMSDYRNEEIIKKFKNRVRMINSLEEIEGL